MQPDILDRHRSLRVLIGLVIIVILIYLITVAWHVMMVVGDIVLLFFLAWVITFLLDPVSSYLVQRGFSRVLAVSLVYLALLVVVSGVIVLAVPALQSQIAQLATQVQSELTGPNLDRLSSGIVHALERVGVSPRDAQNIVSQLVTQIPQKTQQATNQAIASASSLLTTIATVLFDASLVVIISFYMMLDGGRLIESLCKKLPPSWEPDMRLFQGYINEMFGGFFRAQLIVAGIYAFLTWITTWIILAIKSSVPGVGGGAFLAGLLAGIFMLLPFLGAFLAVIPPVLLVVIQTPPDALIIKLVVLIFALGAWQHVVLNVLAPRIYGRHLGMDPLILFAALLLGAKEGGIWGAFFAAPIVAIGYAIFETFYERFTSSHPLFQTEEHVEDAGSHEEPGAEDGRATGAEDASAAHGGTNGHRRAAGGQAPPREAAPSAERSTGANSTDGTATETPGEAPPRGTRR